MSQQQKTIYYFLPCIKVKRVSRSTCYPIIRVQLEFIKFDFFFLTLICLGLSNSTQVNYIKYIMEIIQNLLKFIAKRSKIELGFYISWVRHLTKKKKFMGETLIER